jgi:hypothetical protein
MRDFLLTREMLLMVALRFRTGSSIMFMGPPRPPGTITSACAFRFSADEEAEMARGEWLHDEPTQLAPVQGIAKCS